MKSTRLNGAPRGRAMRVEVPPSGPAPRGNSGAVPPKSLLVPPKRELCPPSEDCAPKKVTDSVPLKGSLRPETPKILIITPELVSKNCFFADFAIKTCSAFVFFFGLHPRIRSWNFTQSSQRGPYVFWSTLSNSKK